MTVESLVGTTFQLLFRDCDFILKESPVQTQCLCILGVMDYLSAEISTSKQKKFSLVTFVDTPGLVDGDMVYPFNVNSAITWLGMSLPL